MASKKINLKTVITGLLMFCIGSCMLLIYQYFSILKWGEEATPTSSDTIIVLGAGVWEHGPSPALQGRIRLAAELYHAGYADHLILSGGLGAFPPAEAEVMFQELLKLGVPEQAMLLEDQATNTTENISYSTRIMQQNDWDTAIIVTDVFHYKRAHYVAKKHDLHISGATVKDSVLYRNQALKFRYTLREVVAWYWYLLKA